MSALKSIVFHSVFIFLDHFYLTKIWNMSVVSILTLYGVVLHLTLPHQASFYSVALWFLCCGADFYLPYGKHHLQEISSGSIAKMWVSWEISQCEKWFPLRSFLSLSRKYASLKQLWWVGQWLSKHSTRGSGKTLLNSGPGLTLLWKLHNGS